MQAILPGLWQLAHSGTYTPPIAAMVVAIDGGRRNLGVVYVDESSRRKSTVFMKEIAATRERAAGSTRSVCHSKRLSLTSLFQPCWAPVIKGLFDLMWI